MITFSPVMHANQPIKKQSVQFGTLFPAHELKGKLVTVTDNNGPLPKSPLWVITQMKQDDNGVKIDLTGINPQTGTIIQGELTTYFSTNGALTNVHRPADTNIQDAMTALKKNPLITEEAKSSLDEAWANYQNQKGSLNRDTFADTLTRKLSEVLQSTSVRSTFWKVSN